MSKCHIEIVDDDGMVDACNKPAAGTITTYDEYDRLITYPACSACLAVAYEMGAYDGEE